MIPGGGQWGLGSGAALLLPCLTPLPNPHCLNPRIAIMIIGTLQVELAIHHAASLKDKRSVVKSLKDRLHREHQVSVAEVGLLDEHRRAILGLAMVSNDLPHTQSVLDRILDKLQQAPDFELADHKKEIFTGQ